MALEEHSFRHLLPTFIIAPGTQVVLKVDKPLPDGTVRQRGSVAVVAESPADNGHAYSLRFADGQTAQASFRELAIRRKEVEDQLALADEDLRPWVVYRCQVGSRAFGLATDDSDDDIRGIYLPQARLHWSLFKRPEQLEFNAEGKDEVYWELEKFVKLALKANPNHDAQLRELEGLLEEAFQQSALPDERDRQAVHRFLADCRLSRAALPPGD